MSQQDGNPATKHVYFDCGLHTAPWTKAGAGCPICHRKSLKDVEEYVNTVARESEQADALTNYLKNPNVGSAPAMRVFETGATRNIMGDKLEYRGFISAQARERFAQYMHSHRTQADGTLRASDNWKKGFPIASYVDSGVRHMADFELAIDAGETEKAVEIACAIWFNIQGFIHETLKASKK